MKRPVLIILAVTVLLIALGGPIFSINVGLATTSSLPKSAESRQGAELLSAQFPQANENPIYIVAEAPNGSGILAPGNLSKLYSLSKWISAQSHVTGLISYPQQCAC